MSIDVSRETEARLTEEARRQGISVDALLHRIINEHTTAPQPARNTVELPVWHLGGVRPLHRRDIYDDAPLNPGLLMRIFWSMQWTPMLHNMQRRVP